MATAVATGATGATISVTITATATMTIIYVTIEYNYKSHDNNFINENRRSSYSLRMRYFRDF